MKVGLLTFHNAINYGAALQAYAFQKALKQKGIDCEIIDYVNEYRGNAYNMIYHASSELRKKKIFSSAKYVAGAIFMSSRKKKFIKFYNENTITTKTKFRNSKEAEVLNTEFDKFIVGSDQVWNYRNNGNDFAFLLDFVNDNDKKISYSSSFGLAQIPDELIGEYKTNLNSIKNISTRESYGVELIKELTGRNAELVLDPVFLLSKEEWLSICENKSNDEKYVFAYTNRDNQWNEFLNTTKYPMDNKSVHKISRYLYPRDFFSNNVKVCYSISPIDFIQEIANAEMVVSASFHCIAMSIILNVPFVAILTGDKGKDERILNILKITGLEDRILSEGMRIEDVNKKIDYKCVEGRLSKYISSSYKFLKDAIYN